MNTLVAKVRRQNLFERGETVVVGVSGGADSVALLDILVHLDRELDLVVAHLNHSLRGDDSDGDERFVFGLASGYGLPFVSRRVDVAALAASERLSLEEAGREARYSFFAETAAAYGATGIAVAHHRDDQAETVLIRLLRGAGGSGLCGMSAVQGMVKRPLLQATRAEIERYLAGRGLSCRTDASNADPRILRNSIRHELLPMLRRYNPNISARLAATAESLALDRELLDELTELGYRRLARRSGSGILFPLTELGSEKRGLRLRLYRRALAELRGDLQRISFAHLEAIDELIFSPRPNARLKLPGDCAVVRSYRSLSFQGAAACVPEWAIAVEGEGRYPLPGGATLDVRLVPAPAVLGSGTGSAFHLDPGRAPFPWTARSFLPGDRLRPLGMSGTQKVKDIFINCKVPLAERRRAPVIVGNDRLLCIVGVRMGDYAKVTERTGSVLRVEILDITP